MVILVVSTNKQTYILLAHNMHAIVVQVLWIICYYINYGSVS